MRLQDLAPTPTFCGITSKTRQFISLGAGVQSSVMLLMAARGELNLLPEAAIFADTQWEPPDVYEHLDWLEKEVSGRIEIVRVTAGNLRLDTQRGKNATGHDFMTMPLFQNGGRSMGRRTCTSQYKLAPIYKELRKRLGVDRVAPRDYAQVAQWVGITTDEASRMKPSRLQWVGTRWPLIELGMTRVDCQTRFAEKYPGRYLPCSACVACPYRSNDEWLDIKANPETWADAVEFDRSVRHADPGYEQFVHRDCKPLDEVDFKKPEYRWPWDEECEGMCGV